MVTEAEIDNLSLESLPPDPRERELRLKELFSRLEPWLVTTARQVIRSRTSRRHRADDAVADVIGDLYLDWDRIVRRYLEGHPLRPLRPFLVTVIRNKLIDHWRRATAHDQGLVPVDWLDDQVPELAATECDPSGDELAAVKKACEKLSAEERELIRLRFEENLTFEEIAAFFDQPLTSVYRNTMQAMKNIRKWIERR